MKRRCFLHIGSGKTGSSSLQRALSLYFSSVNDSRYVFPHIGSLPNNQIFRLAFCTLDQAPFNLKENFEGNELKFTAWQAQIKDEFYANTLCRSDIIISSEFLFHSRDQEITSMISFLSDCGVTDLSIYCYLREPSSYFLSAAQQCIKNRHIIPRLNSRIYDISGAVNAWSRFSQNLTVRHFAPSSLINQSVVDDFFKLLNLQAPPTLSIEKRNTNISSPAEAVQALQDFHIWINNEHIDIPCQIRRKIVGGYLSRLSKEIDASLFKKSRLKPEFASIINSVHSDDIILCQKRYNMFKDVPLEHPSLPSAYPSLFSDLVISFDACRHLQYKNTLAEVIQKLYPSGHASFVSLCCSS